MKIVTKLKILIAITLILLLIAFVTLYTTGNPLIFIPVLAICTYSLVFVMDHVDKVFHES
jgi:hypothetical protein